MSNSLALPTIEVFRDVHYEPSEIDAVLAGIDLVASIAGRLEVLRLNRRIKIGDQDSPLATSMRFPGLIADMNIVMTPKKLPRLPLGIELLDKYNDGSHAITTRCTDGKGIAFINPMPEESMKVVSAHETGHMLGVKDTFNPSKTGIERHCSDLECIMFPFRLMHHETSFEYASGWRGVAEKLGISQPVQISKSHPRAQSFCSDCQEELQVGALRVFQRKNNLPILPLTNKP